MSRSITDIINAWYASTDEVNRMAHDMLEGGLFDTELSREDSHAVADNLMDFMDKPWHWDREHTWWVANEWPDDAESWERGQATDWEIK